MIRKRGGLVWIRKRLVSVVCEVVERMLLMQSELARPWCRHHRELVAQLLYLSDLFHKSKRSSNVATRYSHPRRALVSHHMLTASPSTRHPVAQPYLPRGVSTLCVLAVGPSSPNPAGGRVNRPASHLPRRILLCAELPWDREVDSKICMWPVLTSHPQQHLDFVRILR